jgi:acyl-CoA thioester hydrolase
MPRVRINLPEYFIFSTDVAVRISDINYGGHLGNDAVRSLVHEARVRFFAKHGYGELEVEGVGIVITDAVVIYRSQAFQGDVLRVDVALADPRGTGFDMLYRLTNGTSGREVARAKTGIAFFDYKQQRVVPMPVSFRERFFA